MNNILDKNIKLFRYIKKQEWENFDNLLINNIDYNVKDENSNYLIQYIILYNNDKYLKKILNFNIKLDIIDNEGRSILFIPIKYNYYDIIDILLNNNNKIGILINNIKDIYGNYPLHYAIFFNNVIIFNKLAQSKNINLNIFDKNKNSLIHLIIKNKNIDFLQNIKNLNLNFVNSNNESPLHIASLYDLNNFISYLIDLGVNVNIKEKSGGMTPLMICLLNGNNYGLQYILKNKDININLQENQGNTLLHLAIIENNFEMIDFIINKGYPLNFNIFNLDGNNYLHLILSKILYDNIDETNYNLKYFIINTNLNTQNDDGDTSWHLLIKTKLYIKYLNLFLNKKNNLFIINKLNKTPYDLITDNNLNNVLNVVSESFLNLLKKYDKWTLDWQQKCSKEDADKTKCLKIINKYIIENKISIPIRQKKYCIDIEYPKNIKMTTFTGILLDVIICYIEIMKRNELLYTSITENFMINLEVEKYYKKENIIKELSGDYLNFEIFWIFQNIIFPTNLEESINIFIKNSKQIMAIPLCIDLELGSHANVIIIDKYFKTIERFEPNGSEEPLNYNYNNNLLDYILKTYFSKYFIDYEYLEPIKYLPQIGFQTIEINENKKTKKIGDPGGFCVGWCVFYTEQRIKYLIHPKKLIYKLIIKIKSKNLYFKNLIRSYVNELLIERNKVINELNIDINDIINDNITNDQYKEIEKYIKLLILQLN